MSKRQTAKSVFIATTHTHTQKETSEKITHISKNAKSKCSVGSHTQYLLPAAVVFIHW